MFLLVLVHPGRPGQRAVKHLCVCVCSQLLIGGSHFVNVDEHASVWQ